MCRPSPTTQPPSQAIAELGYGNTPADLIAYSKTEDGKARDYLMLVNFHLIGSTNGKELATYVVEKGKPLITLVK